MSSSRKKPPRSPDGGWGWVIAGCAFFNNCLSDGTCYTFGVFIPALMESFGVSRFALGWITSLQMGLVLCVGPLASLLGNRIGFRLLGCIGSVTAAGGMFIAAFISSDHVALLYLCLGVLVGIGLGFMYLSGMAMVSMYFDQKRAFATGVAVSGSGAGVFLFGQLAPFLIDYFDWRGACLILSGIVLNGCISSLLQRPLVEEDAEDEGFPELDSPSVIALQKLLEQAVVSQQHLPSQASETTNLDVAPASSTSPVPIPTGEKQVMFSGVENQQTSSVDSPNKLTFGTSSFSETGDASTGTEHAEPLLARSLQSPPLRERLMRNPSIRSYAETAAAKEKLRASLFGSNYLSSVVDLRNLSRLRSHTSGSGVVVGPVTIAASVAGSRGEELQFRSLVSITKVTLEEGHKRSSMLHIFCNCPVFTNPAIALFTMSNFLALLVIIPPFTYMGERARYLGFTEEESRNLLPIIGACNCISRVVFGYVASFPQVNKMALFLGATLFLGFLNAAFALLFWQAWAFMLYAALFGTTVGILIMLQTVVLCDMVNSPEALPQAIGMFTLMMAPAVVIANPLAGIIVDMFHSFDYLFLYCGGCWILAFCLSLPLPVIVWRRNRILNRLIEKEKQLQAQQQQQPPVNNMNINSDP